MLGLDGAAGGDEVFWQLVLARVIEPASKLDSLRVLEEAGVAPLSYRTVLRRLPAYAKEAFRQELSAERHGRRSPSPVRRERRRPESAIAPMHPLVLHLLLERRAEGPPRTPTGRRWSRGT